jgi:hypothetical protein
VTRAMGVFKQFPERFGNDNSAWQRSQPKMALTSQ